MPFPETSTGFQVDSAETWTDFHKREVRSCWRSVGWGMINVTDRILHYSSPSNPSATTVCIRRIRFNRRTFTKMTSTDVDIKVEACGICGSDVHTISGGWGSQHFPLCVGHGTSGEAIGCFLDHSTNICFVPQKSSARPSASAPRSL